MSVMGLGPGGKSDKHLVHLQHDETNHRHSVRLPQDLLALCLHRCDLSSAAIAIATSPDFGSLVQTGKDQAVIRLWHCKLVLPTLVTVLGIVTDP